MREPMRFDALGRSFSSRRQEMRNVKGETITLAFFEMAIRLFGELRSVLSRSRLMPGSSPSLATAFHTTERRVTQGCSKDTRDDYARLPSSSRAREECIGNGIALGAVTHVWHTTRANYYAPERGERDRSYRRYNTFVSRGDTPQQGSIRCERAASTDRALRREHMAARRRLPPFPAPLTIVRRDTAGRHKRVYLELCKM